MLPSGLRNTLSSPVRGVRIAEKISRRQKQVRHFLPSIEQVLGQCGTDHAGRKKADENLGHGMAPENSLIRLCRTLPHSLARYPSRGSETVRAAEVDDVIVVEITRDPDPLGGLIDLGIAEHL